jgi:hypothetical protein
MTRLAKRSRRDRGCRLAAGLLFAATSCAVPVPIVPHFDRPTQLVGEWVDVRHTSPGDTALWVLRDNGYDGSAHILATTNANGVTRADRSEHRYGTWYFNGPFADTANRALCFAKRVGRNGPTCLAFVLDTAKLNGLALRRLTIRGYQGEHFTGDRTLLEHKP